MHNSATYHTILRYQGDPWDLADQAGLFGGRDHMRAGYNAPNSAHLLLAWSHYLLQSGAVLMLPLSKGTTVKL